EASVSLAPSLLHRTRPPPRSTLLPYTTLFRSSPSACAGKTRKSATARRFGRPSKAPAAACCPIPPAAKPSERPSTWRKCRGKSRSEEHTSELQSREKLVCRLLLEKKNMTVRAI